MGKKRVVILGAGISGLVAAYTLKDKEEVVLIEKNSYAGGVMHGVEKEGFFFECGPRTFRTKKSPHLLALSQELGLTDQLIGSSSRAKKRYLLHQNRLQEAPSWKFLFNPEMLGEWRQPSKKEDETVYDFAARRFGVRAANLFFDPLSLGVFGCSARQLSVRNCFPKWKEWECRYGSVSGGMIREVFRKKRLSLPKQLIGAPLFSFSQGTRMLTAALEEELQEVIHFEEEVIALERRGQWIVKTTKGEYRADTVISTLPPSVIAKLLQDLVPDVSSLLYSIPMTSITSVHLGYSCRALPYSGFGYLVPTSEQEKILGVVFDSEIFPAHNRGEQTRVTVMIEGFYGEEAVVIARDALHRHLGICQTPDAIHFSENRHAIPAMQIGHEKKIAAIQMGLNRALPQVHLLGNYLGYPSVEECVHRARALGIEQGVGITA